MIERFSYLRDFSDLPARFNELWLLKHEWSRIMRVFKGLPVAPYSLIIHPSSHCNLRCRWCIGENLGTEKPPVSNAMVPRRSLSDIAEELTAGIRLSELNTSSSISEVTFSGLTGEPLLERDDVFESARILSENGIRVGLFTNGAMLDERDIIHYSHFAYILVSVDAGNPLTYSSLKGCKPESFEALLSTCSALSRGANGVRKPEINAGYVVNRESCNEIYDAAKHLKTSGIRYLRLKTDISSSMKLDASDYMVAREQIRRASNLLCDDTFDIVEIHRLSEIQSREEKKRHHSLCLMSKMQTCIGSDRKLYPCNYHPSAGGLSYGDLNTSSFFKIWFSDATKELQKQLPLACPNVCDPFKNRANRLMQDLYELFKNYGEKEVEIVREELLERHGFV